jgi:outer membrane biosynthesis protein TonB
LTTNVWGTATVGPRDTNNGLEDVTLKQWNYWDGKIIKGPDGKYYMIVGPTPNANANTAAQPTPKTNKSPAANTAVQPTPAPNDTPKPQVTPTPDVKTTPAKTPAGKPSPQPKTSPSKQTQSGKTQDSD